MSIVNLGLQCIGIMHKEGSPEFERAVKHSNNLSQVCEAAAKYKEEVKSSLQPPVELLQSVTERLELKGKPFKVLNLPVKMKLVTLGNAYTSLILPLKPLIAQRMCFLPDLSCKLSWNIAVSSGTTHFVSRSVEMMRVIGVARFVWILNYFSPFDTYPTRN